MHEFELINKYFSRLSFDKSSLNLNDDVFFDKSKNWLFLSILMLRVYILSTSKHPDFVVKKILRSSISDLICKGVKPKYYFISGSVIKHFPKKILESFQKSLKEEQKYFIYLSGGDTVFSKN